MRYLPPMLVDDIKRRVMSAMKSGKLVEKEVLRVILGEVQTLAAREGRDPTDADVIAAVKKLVKSNEETHSVATDADQRAQLEQELVILRSLLPDDMSEDQILEALSGVRDALMAAGNDGQATGVAMKHLKGALEAPPDGKLVAAAVKRLRASS